MSAEPTPSDRAIHAAVSVIYFSDSSDYLTGLWSVVRELDPEMATLLESNERLAFEICSERIGDSDYARCEHCGNLLEAHPMSFKTKAFGTLRCTGNAPVSQTPPSEEQR